MRSCPRRCWWWKREKKRSRNRATGEANVDARDGDTKEMRARKHGEVQKRERGGRFPSSVSVMSWSHDCFSMTVFSHLRAFIVSGCVGFLKLSSPLLEKRAKERVISRQHESSSSSRVSTPADLFPRFLYISGRFTRHLNLSDRGNEIWWLHAALL